MATNPDELGALAYTVYADTVGHRAVNGDQLPDWSGLDDRVQGAWRAAAHAVQLKITRDQEEGA
ncbi:hypothetical protein [Streptomyces cylindrosporus]|uniref:Uncharacterized protein n=1 Tax=Streptomyces cylindrosporus TaxID=2927583 RepID=A0ABS9YK79_9ACTN|nr:hypothetical protein [Streptomyces cylindrosporus]MCI3277662.1 hypothetical protein [Streptomyces cylindrosporus]